MSSPQKPLNMKAYGHIPHIPGSRMGPSDHHCHAGQAAIATLKKRDSHDQVTVTVKLDGSCMAVARISDVIVPLSRAGYLAWTSRYEQHQMFAEWVRTQRQRFLDVLSDGERMVGEWLAQAHGTRYDLVHEPFVPFDVMVGGKRLPIAQTMNKISQCSLVAPHSISNSGEPLSLETALAALETPHHGELDPVEGAVWRVERKGKFDFMCKWVRPDKVDGKYLPEITGGGPIWNWRVI